MRIAGVIRGLLILLLALAGCRSRSDLVEAELRTKDRMLREAQVEVGRTRAVNEALEREFLQRQQGTCARPNNIVTAGLKDITLASGTGGVDNDNLPGHEALEVVVVPRDEDSHPVKAVGTLNIAAWEIMPGGVKVPLCTWEVSANDLRSTWKSGLIGSGYHVILNWNKLPTQDKLRVAAQLTLPDGRIFEADKDISIRPLPAVKAPPPEKTMPVGPIQGPTLP
jgi:hypothetical protein